MAATPQVRTALPLIALASALAILLLLSPSGPAAGPPVRASHAGGMDALSIDMDTAGNTATLLDTREVCRQVSKPATTQIDVAATNIPASNAMIGFAFSLHYNPVAAKISVTAESHDFLLRSGTGSNLFGGVTNPTTSDPIPDNDGVFNSSNLDTGPIPGSTESGSGVLSRITLSVAADATNGVYPLTLTDAAHVDTLSNTQIPDAVNNARLAINVSCVEGPAGDPSCSDTFDNDLDGLIDGADPDCVVQVQNADLKLNSVAVSVPPSVSAGTPFDVSATANLHNNGPTTPANADTTFTLSLPQDCDTLSLNPHTVEDTAVSGSVAATTPAASWSVTCDTQSDHSFSVEASTTVDQPNVIDPDTGNNGPAQGQAVNAVTAEADVKVTGVSVSAPATVPANTAFNVQVTATLHNNGPVTPATADAAIDLAAPQDCSRSPNSGQTSLGVALAQSTPLAVQKTWSLTCSAVSSHLFTATASLTLNQLHVGDPTPGNESAQADAATNIVAASADLKVTSVTVGAPASAPIGTNFPVTVNTTVHNNGPSFPINADTTVTLSLPGDCFTPVKTVVFQDASLGPSIAAALPTLTFFVACLDHSHHDITATATIVLDEPSTGDPDPGNNSAVAAASVAVIRTADFKVSGVTVGVPPSGLTGAPFGVTVDASLHNNGPHPAPVVITVTLSTPGDCTAANNPRVVNLTLPTSAATPLPSQTFSVTCTDRSFHDFSATVSLAPPLHVEDPAPDNNTGGSLAATVPLFDVADLKVTAVAVSGPPQGSVGTAFDVSATATIHNNGPSGPANADLSVELSLPGDCSTPDPNPRDLQDTEAPVSGPAALGATWSVTCTDKSFHTFSAGATVTLDQFHVSDLQGANNSLQSSPLTVPIFASADGAITTSALLSPPFSMPANTDTNVTVRKTLHNLGPYGPATFQLTRSATPPSGCTLTAPTATTHSLPVSIATTVDEIWVIRCVSGGPYTFVFQNTLSISDVHVSDPAAANNGKAVAHRINIDSDFDLIPDPTETACGSLPGDSNSIPERIDGTFFDRDDDGDTVRDEALPATALGYDCDGDGYIGSAENNVYNPSTQGDQDPCGTTPDSFPFNLPIGWPADLKGAGIPDSTNLINVADLASYLAPVRYLGTNVGDNPGDRRWDLVPGKGLFLVDINVQDMSTLTSLRPPMLAGARAFLGPPCPYPP